jgi:proteasome lid subunit RPN8/RPN11
MLSARVSIPGEIRAAIGAHAENCSPDECCGLIASDPEGKVRFAYPTTNRAPSPSTYTVDPDEHLGALLHAERMGWMLTGVFHSHPTGPAMPSETDVDQALEPDWLYLIAAGTSLRGFRIRGRQVAEVELA